ncbi:helix-turn-helix domain-containing protein [Streptomyces chattanoogensis]|uniref:helix-turn-helix domain-containing protein n=1 Tax=Streptomyces chattanoogensis TaxID=66876 RepID=UPI000B28364D|nr:helix-turn-helix transcriptional regulator [Streptomyces chattanoogensis]
MKVTQCGRVRGSGQQLADLLGCSYSKIYKLENGQQTATVDDVRAWAEATGHPEATDELLASLTALEPPAHSWRTRLTFGHLPVQQTWTQK